MKDNLYKIGDKVRIKSSDWYNKNKDDPKFISIGSGFLKEMSKWCGKIVTIDRRLSTNRYSVKEDKHRWLWCKEFFEPMDNIYVEEE
jgi:hypothetical protein